MQLALGFGAAGDMAGLREDLRCHFGGPPQIRVRTPIGQLVKSLIGGRTRDEVSLYAYHRLLDAYPSWSDLAAAPAADVEAVIGAVTFPEIKARHLHQALHVIAVSHPDFDLSFLGRLSVARALSWLERLPGVGRKVAASTLNFSTLRMPAFVIDTHVLRILQRFGFIGSKAGILAAYDAVIGMMAGWSAAELAELHILMKRLGQEICQADQGLCAACPLNRQCRSSGKKSA